MWSDIFKTYLEAKQSQLPELSIELQTNDDLEQEASDQLQRVLVYIQLAHMDKKDLELLLPLQEKIKKLERQQKLNQLKIKKLAKRLETLQNSNEESTQDSL